MKFCRANTEQKNLPIDHLPSIASAMFRESRDVGPPRIHVIWPEGPATCPPSTASSPNKAPSLSSPLVSTIHTYNRSTGRRERAGSLHTLVATTTLSRGTRRARNQRPRSSSLRPRVSLRCGTGYLTSKQVCRCANRPSPLSNRGVFLGKIEGNREGDEGAGEPTSRRSRRS